MIYTFVILVSIELITLAYTIQLKTITYVI